MVDQRLGTIADVQCGGWSTTLLNSDGAIYIFGVLDGESRRQSSHSQDLRRLGFPNAYPPATSERYEPSTAIKQFSTGRKSVLGLADDGKVWMWQSDIAFQVKPIHVDLVANKVIRVAAGWDCNSMYVRDVGIVYWKPVQESAFIAGGQQETLAVGDAMLLETVTIPGTGVRRKNDRVRNKSPDAHIGEVTQHIVLSGYIVFITHINKVFCYPTIFPTLPPDQLQPVELTTFYPESPSEECSIRDLQGSFTKFAVFTRAGSVLMGSKSLLDAYYNTLTPSTSSLPQLPRPEIISSLQSSSVVSMAFGDHHFHALRSSGTITSYGKELEGCGALGLGNYDLALMRGVNRTADAPRDVHVGSDEGRTVFFEPLMQTWLDHLKCKMKYSESWRQLAASNGESCRRAVGDYVEQKGADWEKSVTKDEDTELGAYFVIKVASAGWHSAALVLMDASKAERVRDGYRISHPTVPSLAPSTQSGDSRETVESPFEQLSNTVDAIGSWFWEMGRRFLGLTQRDERRATVQDQAESAVDSVEYTWVKEPFPQLRLENGTVVVDESSG